MMSPELEKEAFQYFSKLTPDEIRSCNHRKVQGNLSIARYFNQENKNYFRWAINLLEERNKIFEIQKRNIFRSMQKKTLSKAQQPILQKIDAKNWKQIHVKQESFQKQIISQFNAFTPGEIRQLNRQQVLKYLNNVDHFLSPESRVIYQWLINLLQQRLILLDLQEQIRKQQQQKRKVYYITQPQKLNIRTVEKVKKESTSSETNFFSGISNALYSLLPQKIDKKLLKKSDTVQTQQQPLLSNQQFKSNVNQSIMKKTIKQHQKAE